MRKVPSKGGGFYDRLGADVGTKNPKKYALSTFVEPLAGK